MILSKDFLFCKNNRKLRILFTAFIFCLFISCDKKDVFRGNINTVPEINFVKTFGGSKNDAGQAIINTSDNGYAI